MQAALDTKIDTVTSKGLSANDYTTAEKTKLSGIATGAEVNVQADWKQNDTVADNFIKNKPTIPAAANGSETKLAAGTNILATGTGTAASPYTVAVKTLTVGQKYQGGIILARCNRTTRLNCSYS